VINGVIVTQTGIPVLIATLGTQLAFRGIANMIGAASNMSNFGAAFDSLGAGTWDLLSTALSPSLWSGFS